MKQSVYLNIGMSLMERVERKAIIINATCVAVQSTAKVKFLRNIAQSIILKLQTSNSHRPRPSPANFPIIHIKGGGVVGQRMTNKSRKLWTPHIFFIGWSQANIRISYLTKTRPPETLKYSKSEMCTPMKLKPYHHVYLSTLTWWQCFSFLGI